MKKLFIEITAVLSLAVLIAVLFNFFSPKPISWLTEKKNIKTVDDSILFGKKLNSNDSIKKNTDVNELNSKNTKSIENKHSFTTPDSKSKNINTNEEVNNQEYKTISYKQLLKVIDNPKFLLIDARPPHEWEEAKIGNAINIFPFDNNQEQYFKKITSQPKNVTLIVYCSGGTCEASHKVVSDLKSFGFNNVYLFSGGWEVWTKQKGK